MKNLDDVLNRLVSNSFENLKAIYFVSSDWNYEYFQQNPITVIEFLSSCDNKFKEIWDQSKKTKDCIEYKQSIATNENMKVNDFVILINYSYFN